MKNREGLGVTHEERRREGLARLTAIRACEGKVLHGAGLLRPVRAVPPTSGFCSQVVPLAYGIHQECFFFFRRPRLLQAPRARRGSTTAIVNVIVNCYFSLSPACDLFSFPFFSIELWARGRRALF